MAKFTVVGGDASSDLAKRIARKLKSPYIKTEKKIFPDGESKVTINQIPKKSIVIVVQSTNPPVDSNLLELLSIVSKVQKFSNLLKTDFITLKKHRDRKTGKVNILSGKVDVKNRDLILVDDMVSTGGSIVKATQFLKKQKCRRVFVACTHALLVNDATKKIKNAGVTQIISTNTIPGESAKVDVSRVISDALR